MRDVQRKETEAMVYYDDCDNPPEFYDCKTVVARKAHKCCECLAEIEKGESHERYTGKWEGDIDTYRTCSLCLSARKAMRLESWPFGCLIDAADERDFPGVAEVMEFRERRQENWRKRELPAVMETVE